MARFVSLNFRAGCSCLAAGGLGVMTCLSAPLRAQQPMAPTQVTPAPAKTPATNAAPVIPPPPDTFNRYGKIWAPSDDAAHPIKLNIQFPSVANLKIPSQDELKVRDKLEQLATLSDADIHKQLDQWPPYGKMNLRDEGTMLQRIQDFRDYRTKVAMQKAHDLGLSTLPPDQMVRFEKEYWDKRLQMDRELAKQFEPIFRAREQKMKDELFREFSSANPGPVAQAPKPPPPGPPPPNKPPQPPVTPIKAAASTLGSAPPQPMAQAPR